MPFFNDCDPRKLFSCCPFTLFQRSPIANTRNQDVRTLDLHPNRPARPLIPAIKNIADTKNTIIEITPWTMPTQPQEISDEFIDKCLNELNNTIGFEEESIANTSFKFLSLQSPGASFTGTHYHALHNANTHFISLNRNNKSGRLDDHGWKFHIDLEHSPENLQKAWDCVVPIVFKYGINLFKMMSPETPKNTSSVERGRSMTFYVQREMLTLEQWKNLLGEINETLVANDIKSELRSSACNELIPGNPYFSYRNDDNGHGGYVSCQNAIDRDNPYNPARFDDPFDGTMRPGNTQTFGL